LKQNINGESDDETSDETSTKQVKQVSARCKCAKQASMKEGKKKQACVVGGKRNSKKKKKKNSLNTVLQMQLCTGEETLAGPLPLSLTWGCQWLVRLGLLLCFKKPKVFQRCMSFNNFFFVCGFSWGEIFISWQTKKFGDVNCE
jgi:hypothetical protein